jgi:iron complex transport system ATP-binding protein
VSQAVLRLGGVRVRRSGRWILSSIDWTVRSGERWVVVGPNGAGKTTLLAIAATYLWPTTGSVEVLG